MFMPGSGVSGGNLNVIQAFKEAESKYSLHSGSVHGVSCPSPLLITLWNKEPHPIQVLRILTKLYTFLIVLHNTTKLLVFIFFRFSELPYTLLSMRNYSDAFTNVCQPCPDCNYLLASSHTTYIIINIISEHFHCLV